MTEFKTIPISEMQLADAECIYKVLENFKTRWRNAQVCLRMTSSTNCLCEMIGMDFIKINLILCEYMVACVVHEFIGPIPQFHNLHLSNHIVICFIYSFNCPITMGIL